MPCFHTFALLTRAAGEKCPRPEWGCCLGCCLLLHRYFTTVSRSAAHEYCRCHFTSQLRPVKKRGPFAKPPFLPDTSRRRLMQRLTLLR
ncbi:hypothetical protein BSU04_07210 [Caballeronia sordidicola]|uniref:Uncharacterized protein n=1 Tax=Caballeronia sordidicola TaxID=196367 RepID=A0A226WVZ7_CABSO|nr:hypothetical protein BSU04_30060 [Caballeronia sordidicola]OXC79464.1 hypothetical protein BSU04_07210 [Caballeronia sordidicola]